MSELEQGVVRFTVGSWAFLKIAVAAGDWARVLSAEYHRRPVSDGAVFRYMRADLEMAVEQSRLDVEVDTFLLEQLAALMMAALQRQLHQGMQVTLMRRVCESMLRVIGLSPAAATRVVDKAEQHSLISSSQPIMLV